MSDDQNLFILYGYVLGCVKATKAKTLSSDRYRAVIKGVDGKIMLLSGFEPVEVHNFFICMIERYHLIHDIITTIKTDRK